MPRSARTSVRRRRLHRGRKARGIAEIVGTLMLILIVVAAAIALAAFVASYQKQLQAEESQAQQRSLESLKILSVTPTLNTSDTGEWSSFTFVLASEYINPSSVDAISLNGQPIRYYYVQNLSSPASPPTQHDTTVANDTLVLSPRQEVIVGVELDPSGGVYPNYSMFDPTFVLSTSDYIQLSVYTALQNTFTTVFLPPTAIAYVTTLTSYSSNEPVQIPVLVGTDSFQPGANGTIVQWEWSMTEAGNSTYTGGPTCPVAGSPFEGSEWELEGNASTSKSYTYTATLTVTGNDGLAGVTTLSFSSYVLAACET